MNFNVNFNVLLSKYIVHPLVKIKKDLDNKPLPWLQKSEVSSSHVLLLGSHVCLNFFLRVLSHPQTPVVLQFPLQTIPSSCVILVQFWSLSQNTF